MGEHRRITKAAGVLFACALAPAGCRSGSDDAAPAPAVTEAEPVQKAPVDALLPGEIAQGSEEAFGLPIPRAMTVRARFPDAVFAAGELPAEQVAKYVRRRVVAERVETGPAKTVFARATLREAPVRTMRIEVITQGGATTLVVRDETRPAAKEGLSEEQRWRELGLTPQGAPLDPTRLE